MWERVTTLVVLAWVLAPPVCAAQILQYEDQSIKPTNPPPIVESGFITKKNGTQGQLHVHPGNRRFCDPFCPRNGGRYLLVHTTDPIEVAQVGGGTFSLIGFDGAESHKGNQDTYAAAIQVTGFMGGGGTVVQTFALDFVQDGPGGEEDFEPFALNSSFTNLLRVEFKGINGGPLQRYSLDNIAVATAATDDTPPVITPTVSGALGDNDWYTSDIDISWTFTDDESDVTIRDGCTDEMVTSDTSGDTFNCEAESDGGTAEASVTVKRDATDPTVTYSGNDGTYDVSDDVAIACSSSDAMSGIEGDTCADVSGPAYTFGLGTTSHSATATDNAGNEGNGSASFDVTASFDGLCSLVESFVSHAGVANSMCVKIAAAERADARGQTTARDGALSAFFGEVEAQAGTRVDPDDAAVLIAIATALMS